MQYIGTKIINAEPMTREAYNEFRGWTLPADEEGADEGYLVEYLDGGKPNVTTHSGYVSWSPKAQFDAAYIALPVGSEILPAHQQRVVAEKAALDVKADALAKFVGGSSIFDSLDVDEKARLRDQLDAMARYSSILANRIAAF